MREKYLFVILIMLSAVIAGCNNSDSNESKKAESAASIISSEMEEKDTKATKENTENKKGKFLLEVGAKGDFLCNYDTIGQLKENAELIIRGTVLETNTKCDEIGTVYTEYLVSIDETLNGKQKEGDTIMIRRIGGIIKAKEYLEKQDDPKLDEFREKVEKSQEELYVKYTFDNAWLPEIGKEYVWFLCTEGGAYTPLNVYQGVYEYENGIMERFEMKDNKSDIETLAYKDCKKEIMKD